MACFLFKQRRRNFKIQIQKAFYSPFLLFYECLFYVPFPKFPGRGSRGPQHQLMTIVGVTPYLFDTLATLWLGCVGRIMQAAVFTHLPPSKDWHDFKELGELEQSTGGHRDDA